jgi:hypothetical protein
VYSGVTKAEGVDRPIKYFTQQYSFDQPGSVCFTLASNPVGIIFITSIHPGDSTAVKLSEYSRIYKWYTQKHVNSCNIIQLNKCIMTMSSDHQLKSVISHLTKEIEYLLEDVNNGKGNKIYTGCSLAKCIGLCKRRFKNF